jgi:hypothetical protein
MTKLGRLFSIQVRSETHTRRDENISKASASSESDGVVPGRAAVVVLVRGTVGLTTAIVPWRLPPCMHALHVPAPVPSHTDDGYAPASSGSHGWEREKKEGDERESKGQGNKRPGRSAMPCGRPWKRTGADRSNCRPALALLLADVVGRHWHLTEAVKRGRPGKRRKAMAHELSISCKPWPHTAEKVSARSFDRVALHCMLVGHVNAKILLNLGHALIYMYCFGGFLITQKFQCVHELTSSMDDVLEPGRSWCFVFYWRKLQRARCGQR